MMMNMKFLLFSLLVITSHHCQSALGLKCIVCNSNQHPACLDSSTLPLSNTTGLLINSTSQAEAANLPSQECDTGLNTCMKVVSIYGAYTRQAIRTCSDKCVPGQVSYVNEIGSRVNLTIACCSSDLCNIPQQFDFLINTASMSTFYSCSIWSMLFSWISYHLITFSR